MHGYRHSWKDFDMTLFSSPAARWLAAGAVCFTSAAWAGEGHDHGDAPASTTGTALPRFTAVSETLELVGALDGRQLTLYLDRYADNSPVQGAQIELEIGGVKVPVQAHEHDVYEATLAEELKPGVTPVTATVISGVGTELLAGEFDLHEEAHADDAADKRAWPSIVAWAAGSACAFALLVWRIRLARIARSERTGAAT